MACHDFEGHVETPDRSLGSLSLNATGEQLDDIQVNLDRMYLESPAPTSMPGSGDYVSGATFAGGGPRRLDYLFDESTKRPGGPDPEAFDKLPLLGEDVYDSLDLVDWLKAPAVTLPNNFDENDRSFLDTNLLYSRFNLLNFVTRIINEDMYAETKKNSPPTPPSINSNLTNEAAGSGATFRVNRPPRRGVIGNRRISDGAEDAKLAQNGMVKNGAIAAVNMSAISSPKEDSEEMSASAIEARRRQKYLTYRRPPIQRQRDIALYSQESSQSVESSSEGYTVPQAPGGEYVDPMHAQPHNDNSHPGGNLTYNGGRMRKQSFNSSGSNLDETEFIPNELSPTGPAGGCGLIQGRHSDNNAPSPTSEDDKFSLGYAPATGLRHPYGDVAGDDDLNGSYSQEIDTRTYTRPKKTRMSLGAPNRQLNTTAINSPLEYKNSATQRLLNTTMDLSPIESRRPALGSSSQLNRTIDISPELNQSNQQSSRNVLNTTMDMGSDRNVGETLSNSANLNETFVSENTPERSRRVTRNLSYVVRRDEESPNNNASPQGQGPGAKSDLNNTFQYEPDGDLGSPAAKGSQNTSMEDLNSRVASQIRSLGCSTISRGKIPDGILRGGPNMEEARLVARTSSTDTYSVAHSSESPTSSGLSSPMDAQSYDDIQTSDSTSVRRSMPNLAVIRSSTTMRSGLAFPQAGTGQLRKNHYISDSKLSHVGSNNDHRPRLSIHSSSSSNSGTLTRGLRQPENFSTRARGVDRNTSTPAALNSISSGLPTGAPRVYSAQALGSATMTRASASSRQTVGGSMGNVRSTGMAPPRYTSAPTSTVGSGLRQPKAMVAPQSSTERLRNPSAPGIPVPTFRNQSRIPGPGQLRFSRPPSSKLPYRGGSTVTRPGASQKGTVDDWRDGCY